MVQPFVLSTNADCLILLDCCYAARGGKNSGTIFKGTNEIIAACGPESVTIGVERRSFTSFLVHELERSAHAFRKGGKRLTAVGLHGALFRFSQELQYGPFYVRLASTEYSSIDLTPLFKTPISGGNDSGFRMSVSNEESTPSDSSSLNNRPTAVARVLVAIHLSKPPRDDLIGLLHSERLTPDYVNSTEVLAVEAVFESNSTLALLSMPISAWDLLPEDAPCSYVGMTYTKNLLGSSVTGQLLLGSDTAKSPNALLLGSDQSPSPQDRLHPGEKASGLEARAVRLEDPATGAVHHTLKVHSDRIGAAALSSDSRLVASGADDKEVRLGDPTTEVVRRMLKGHSNWVRAGGVWIRR